MRRNFLKKFLIAAVGIAAIAKIGGADPADSKPPLATLTAYTTLPPETVSVLSQEYERESRIRVNFIPLPADETLERLENPPEDESVDLILADREVLMKIAEKDLLRSYVSESSDAVRPSFKDENGYWVGTWYDPIVFCANRDYLNAIERIPDAWQDLAREDSIRIGITDFLAADASANLMFQMIAQYGDVAAYQILDGIHPKVVQYTKYLSNPVRQAGMGEVDLAIAVESESLRYLQDGYPVKIIYPTDGTAYMLFGTAIPTTGSINAEKFSDWLLSDQAQAALQKNGFYFLSTNPSSIAYKTFAGKNLVLFDQLIEFTADQENEFLDRWVKDIRLKELPEVESNS